MSEERTAPVQVKFGESGIRIPWAVHLRCYEGYCKEYGNQKALIEGNCRGGFGVDELDRWAPGWRDEMNGWNDMKARLAALEEENQKSADRLRLLEQFVVDFKNADAHCDLIGYLEGSYADIREETDWTGVGLASGMRAILDSLEKTPK